MHPEPHWPPGWTASDGIRVARYRFPAGRSAAAFAAELFASDWDPDGARKGSEVFLRVVEGPGLAEGARELHRCAVRLGGVPLAEGDGAKGWAESLWVRPGHFYSPLPDPDEVASDGARIFRSEARELPGIDLRLASQLDLARRLARFYGEEEFAEEERSDRRFRLGNGYFEYGDAFVYHALLREVAPRRVIEVGSGWSSALLLDTAERWLEGRVEATFIEPYPERLLGVLRESDQGRVRLMRSRVQEVPLEEFDTLEAGDFLFVDSSHVLKTGSDVHHLLFEVLPRLVPGVWVHFHDVHAHFEYPRAWVEEGRAWNEAYALRAFLAYNLAFQIELHAPTLAVHHGAELLPLMPNLGRNVGGSLWLRRRASD